jgi:protein-disulfide isomerase
MSTQTQQRGRRVRRDSGNRALRNLYLIGGGVLLIAVVALGSYLFFSRQNAAVAQSYPWPTGKTADGFYYKGNPDAPVKVIKYSDFECPACRNYTRTLAKIVNDDYVATGRIQFIYHEFPLQSHPNAVPAAAAARCAGDQDRFWQMHDILFDRQSEWAGVASPTNLYTSYAREVGLNTNQFETCMSQGTHTAAVAASGQAALSANIPATPTFIVNGQQVDSSGLIPAIDAALRGN